MTAQHTAGWVLPDDGIVDDAAVEIAAKGERPVALTRTERQLAATLILARGGTAYVVSRRLRVSGSTAIALAAIALAANSPLPASPPRAGQRRERSTTAGRSRGETVRPPAGGAHTARTVARTELRHHQGGRSGDERRAEARSNTSGALES